MIPFFSGTIANRLHIEPFGNMSFNAIKSTTCDKQDVLCIDFNEFLICVWPLGGTLTTVPSNNFNNACLPLLPTRHVDGRVVAFTSNLIDFVDKYNAFSALLGQSAAEEVEENTHILSNITCLCQNSRSTIAKGTLSIFVIVLAIMFYLFQFLQPSAHCS